MFYFSISSFIPPVTSIIDFKSSLPFRDLIRYFHRNMNCEKANKIKQLYSNDSNSQLFIEIVLYYRKKVKPFALAIISTPSICEGELELFCE